MASSTTPRFKLTYFNLRGVVEVSRYLLAISDTPYEDVRYSLEFGTPGDFSTIIRPEFDTAKAAGTLTPSMGKLPLFEVDGTIFSQSKAIERFIAAETNMMGSNSVEAACIDAICEHIRDIKDGYQKAKKEEGGADKWFNQTMKEHSEKLELTIPEFLASGISLADVVIYNFYDQFFDRKEEAMASISECPKLQAIVCKVKNNDRVVDWEAKRPQTIM